MRTTPTTLLCRPYNVRSSPVLNPSEALRQGTRLLGLLTGGISRPLTGSVDLDSATLGRSWAVAIFPKAKRCAPGDWKMTG